MQKICKADITKTLSPMAKEEALRPNCAEKTAVLRLLPPSVFTDAQFFFKN